MTAPLVSMTDRPYQLLPPLTVEQRDLLRQSIKENGVLEPVVFDEDGEILDGHHRVEIAEELGIDYPRRVIDDLDRPGKHMYALTVNVARRQLDQSARSTLVAQMRIRGMSIRRIAEALGISRGTAANDLARLSNSGQLEQPERITGADGKERPATRPAATFREQREAYEATQTPEPVGADAAPPAGSGTTPAPVANAPDPLRVPDPGASSPAPGRHLAAVSDPVAVLSPEGQRLADEIAADSERRAAAAGIQSVLTYMTSRVLTPEALAQQYVIALGDFSAEELRFAAKTLAALADLKEL